MEKDVLFWEVDMQYDFIMPGGKLPISGAETIVSAVNRLRRYIFTNEYSLAGSMDCHKHGDEEISDNPDFQKTFPFHCETNAPGAGRVGDIGDEPEIFIPKNAISDAELEEIAANEPLNVFFHKDHFDVFTNPNITRFMELMQPKQIIIFGVASDVCVRFAVDGLLNWGKAELTVVTDCIHGLGIVAEEDLFKEWEGSGVKLVTSEEITSKVM